MTTAAFWRATAERAIKTVCETAVALMGTGAIGLLDVDWAGVASGALLAGVLSVLTSIGSGTITGAGPGLSSAETITDA